MKFLTDNMTSIFFEVNGNLVLKDVFFWEMEKGERTYKNYFQFAQIKTSNFFQKCTSKARGGLFEGCTCTGTKILCEVISTENPS